MMILGSLSRQIIKRFATCYDSVDCYRSIYLKDAAYCAHYNLNNADEWKNVVESIDPFGDPINFSRESIEAIINKIYFDKKTEYVGDVYFVLGAMVRDRKDLAYQFKQAFLLSHPREGFIKIFKCVEKILRKIKINYNGTLEQFLEVFSNEIHFEETLYLIPYDLESFVLPEELEDYCC